MISDGINWELYQLVTWWPEQMMLPLGILALKGLCTGQEVRGPHRDDGPGNGTELKLFGWLLQGLHNGGGGNEPWRDVIDGPCASIGRWWGIAIEEAGPGPLPWWHIKPPQLGIVHWPPLFTPALLQYGSTMKLSWLLEHFINLGAGGDDCREWIFFPIFFHFNWQSSTRPKLQLAQFTTHVFALIFILLIFFLSASFSPLGFTPDCVFSFKSERE